MAMTLMFLVCVLGLLILSLRKILDRREQKKYIYVHYLCVMIKTCCNIYVIYRWSYFYATFLEEILSRRRIGKPREQKKIIAITVNMTIDNFLHLHCTGLHWWPPFFASYTTRKLGRWLAMLFAGIIFLLGSILNAAAVNFAMLVLGRILLGYGVGFGNQLGLYN